MAKKVEFCSECGNRYPVLEWPRQCSVCFNMEWDNPKAVVVVLQGILRQEENGSFSTGLAIARRAIQPGLGKWALISGYSGPEDKSLEIAARREWREETGLELAGDPRLSYSVNSENNNMLAFCLVDKPMPIEQWREAQRCHENFEFGVMWDTSLEHNSFDVAFPLHEQAIRAWFARTLPNQNRNMR